MPTVELTKVESAKAESVNRSIFYRVSKPGDDNRALVLIHGAGGTLLHWPPRLRRLPGITVYALDLPGHGDSGGDSCAELADYRDTVLDFIGQLGLEQVILGGHSMGGAIALEVALTRPQQLDGLVLMGTGARLNVAPALLTGLQNAFEATTAQIARAAYGPATPDSIVADFAAQLQHASSAVVYNDFLACSKYDVSSQLAEVTCPALILCGADDRLTPPKLSAYLHEHLPASTFHMVPAAGHMVMLEQEELVMAHLSAFLRAESAAHPHPQPTTEE